MPETCIPSSCARPLSLLKLIGPFFRRQAKLVTSFLADCRLLLITNFLPRAARAFPSSPRCRQHVPTKSTKWSGVAISEKVMQVIALFPFDKTASSDRMNHRQASTDKMIPRDQLICRLLRLSDIQTTANVSLRHSCRREAFHIYFFLLFLLHQFKTHTRKKNNIRVALGPVETPRCAVYHDG